MFNKITILAVIGVSLIFTQVQARNYSTAHIFSPGDVISADMMNEIFSRISASEGTVEMTNIVGVWKCNSLVNRDATGCTGDWQNYGNLYQYLNNSTLTIVDDGDGSYSYSTSSPSPLSCIISVINNGSIAIKNNMLFVSDPGIQLYPRLISNTRFTASLPALSGFVNPFTMSLECDRQQTPPLNPTDLVITTSVLANTLTWTDNSSDEVSFKVYKKTSATGGWSLIDFGAGLTVLADVITYTDTVSATGDYWYRVKASNSYGDSIGSKVVKVTNIN